MRITFQLVLGIVICLTLFLLTVNLFKEDLGPFFSLVVPIGLVFGFQLIILDKLSKKS